MTVPIVGLYPGPNDTPGEDVASLAARVLHHPPFGAHQRWSNDGNTKDAEILDQWERDRKRLLEMLCVGCRPVRRTEKVPWHQAVGRIVPDGDTIVQVSAWNSGSQGFYLARDGEKQYEVSGGLVEVLVVDETPTDPELAPEIWRVEFNWIIRGDEEIQVYRAQDTDKLACLVRDLLNDYEQAAIDLDPESDPDLPVIVRRRSQP